MESTLKSKIVFDRLLLLVYIWSCEEADAIRNLLVWAEHPLDF